MTRPRPRRQMKPWSLPWLAVRLAPIAAVPAFIAVMAVADTYKLNACKAKGGTELVGRARACIAGTVIR